MFLRGLYKSWQKVQSIQSLQSSSQGFSLYLRIYIFIFFYCCCHPRLAQQRILVCKAAFRHKRLSIQSFYKFITHFWNISRKKNAEHVAFPSNTDQVSTRYRERSKMERFDLYFALNTITLCQTSVRLNQLTRLLLTRVLKLNQKDPQWHKCAYMGSRACKKSLPV